MIAVRCSWCLAFLAAPGACLCDTGKRVKITEYGLVASEAGAMFTVSDNWDRCHKVVGEEADLVSRQLDSVPEVSGE